MDVDEPVLIWQYDNFAQWEHDWIREILPEAARREHFDWRRYRTLSPRMYVVDNRLSPGHLPYFREAAHRGCKIVLLHLGDGGGSDDRSAYPFCVQVWRNHWSGDVARIANVRYLPLGYKAGFLRRGATRDAAARPALWGFAGDFNKTTRRVMLEAMRQVGEGAEHLTDRWESPEALSVVDYRAFMDRILFAPCPKGFVSIDSFRLFEALEAGCIPIVERKGPGLEDYYMAAFGPHPIPTVAEWSEAPGLVRGIMARGEAESVRQACFNWWQAHKAKVRAAISAAI